MTIEANKNVDYRKDMDGLRAIAVLSVVFYHIFETLLPGGFVGVDIFFVISGYLISKHIILELETKKFSLTEFYMRRIRRILPAFVFFLLMVIVASCFILTPPDLQLFAKSALAAMMSASNIYLWRFVSAEYFGTDANVLPLLHTWSLGVEEQFYLVWPIALFLLSYVLQKLNKPMWLGVITLLLGTLSFFLYYYLRQHEVMVFYTPITRAFELLIGASLAFYAGKLAKPTPIRSLLLSILGLVFIIYSIVYLGREYYPSSYILLPCIGAGLLIYAGETQTIVSKLMSWRIMVFVGLISYSLYLWHWPFVAYANYLGITINALIGTFIFISAVILSIISYWLVEQPFRYKYKFNFKISLLLFVALPTFAVCALVVICRLVPNVGYNKTSLQALATINNYLGPWTDKQCIDVPSSPQQTVPACHIGNLNAIKTDALIIGDSHARALAGMLNVLLKDAQLKGNLITQTGSIFILGEIKDWRKNLPMQRNAQLLKLIKENHYKYVIVGGFWNYYHDSLLRKDPSLSHNSYKTFQAGLDKAINAIVAAKSIPVLIEDVPPLLAVPLHCGFSRLGLNNCANSIEKIAKVQAATKNILLSMKRKYPTLVFLNPNQIICRENKCVSALNGIPIYHTGRENSHLNYAGSELVGKMYLQSFKNPFRTYG